MELQIPEKALLFHISHAETVFLVWQRGKVLPFTLQRQLSTLKSRGKCCRFLNCQRKGEDFLPADGEQNRVCTETLRELPGSRTAGEGRRARPPVGKRAEGRPAAGGGSGARSPGKPSSRGWQRSADGIPAAGGGDK